MSELVRFTLCARQPELGAAWEESFADVEAVEVSVGDILQLPADAIVSPANSFGYMDGGIDLAYSKHFGWEPEKRLRALLLADHHGELPVGQAVIVELGARGIRWLISAPTMRVPQDVSKTVNAYLAFRAILRAIQAHNQSGLEPIRTVLCPGLGTGEGRMTPELCALQMREAWQVVMEGELLKKGGLAGAVRNHLALLGESE